MGDPVAWTMIEPGWKVFDAEGDEIGDVHEVAGDENADIFDGLAMKQGILGKDTAASDGQTYVLTLTVGSGAAASTVSQVLFAALVV